MVTLVLTLKRIRNSGRDRFAAEQSGVKIQVV
jgi:hypothetical protein